MIARLSFGVGLLALVGAGAVASPDAVSHDPPEPSTSELDERSRAHRMAELFRPMIEYGRRFTRLVNETFEHRAADELGGSTADEAVEVSSTQRTRWFTISPEDSRHRAPIDPHAELVRAAEPEPDAPNGESGLSLRDTRAQDDDAAPAQSFSFSSDSFIEDSLIDVGGGAGQDGVPFTRGSGLAYRIASVRQLDIDARVGVASERSARSRADEMDHAALFGVALTHRVHPRAKVTALVDLFSPVDQDLPLRGRARAAYEMAWDRDGRVLFRLGVEDRFAEGEREPLRPDYFASLEFRF